MSCLARPPPCQQQAPPVICLCPVQLTRGPDRCLPPRGCTDTHLSAKMEGHDRIVLGVQDEQRAGDVLHAVEGERTRPRSQGDGWGLLAPWPHPWQGPRFREYFTMLFNSSNSAGLLFTRELKADFSDVSSNIYSRCQSNLEINLFTKSGLCIVSENCT